ncbi:S8 family serine peptidase [bacterium]|nr:S8 family serine peptidase [bacterium]
MKKLLLLFLITLSALADPGKIELAKTTIDANSAKVMSVAAQEPVCAPSPAGTRLYLAQPERNFTQEEQSSVTDLGLSFYGFVPPNAYILEGTEEQIAELKGIFSFIYLGEFLPEYKTVCELDNIIYGPATFHNKRYVLVAVTRSEFLPSVKKVLDDEGVKYNVLSENICPALTARLSGKQIENLAKMGEVASIESYSDPVVMNDVARSDYCCNLEDLIMDGYDGSTQTVCLHDTGLDNGDVNNIHPDFKGKRVSGRATSGVANERGGYDKWYDSSGHGTHVAGSMCGNGAASDGQFKGMASAASIFVLAGGGAAGLYAGTDADLEITYEEGARVMNNSWGSKSDKGAYNNISRTYDSLIWNHPDYSICFASGNWQAASPEECTLSKGACTKNAIVVGASESYRPTESPDASPDNGKYQGLYSLSGRGPCSDGRVKPDIVAPGSCIYSCNASRELTSVRSEYYVSKTGCSMSSPIAAGCAAVIRDYLVKNRGVSSPSASLVKAIMLCGARTLYPGQYGSIEEIPPARPNRMEGHGHINVQQSLEPVDGDMLFEEYVLSVTGIAVTNIFEKLSDAPLAVGLVWSDYPGTVSAAKALVNDLDLTLIAPGGARHTLNDSVNNAEVIRLDDSPMGRYTVIIKGSNIMNGPQPCSLVINYGRSESPYPIEGITPPRETLWTKLDVDTTSQTRLLTPTYPIPYSTDWAKGYYDRRISVTAVQIDDASVSYGLLTTSGEETGKYVWDYTSISNLPYRATYCLKYRIFNGNTTFESKTSEAYFTVVPEPGIIILSLAAFLCALYKRA